MIENRKEDHIRIAEGKLSLNVLSLSGVYIRAKLEWTGRDLINVLREYQGI